MMTNEELADLITKAQAGDKPSRDAVVLAHQKLVAKVVRRCRVPNEFRDDMLQQGILELCRALDKFNPRLGYQFSTYAIWLIWASISRHMNRETRHNQFQLRDMDVAASVADGAVAADKHQNRRAIIEIADEKLAFILPSLTKADRLLVLNMVAGERSIRSTAMLLGMQERLLLHVKGELFHHVKRHISEGK